MNWVIVASTAGSVMDKLFENSYFRNRIRAVVSDRDCPALEKARIRNIPNRVIREADNREFSDRLLAYLQEIRADYVLSFFTRLFAGTLVSTLRNRIVNVHPSLLPAFKGLDGFGDTVRSGSKYAGSTIHFIDERMDAGAIILQSVCILDPGRPRHEIRDRIFAQQCRGVLQVMRWIEEGRVEVLDGRVCVKNAAYVDLEFSPNLDFEDALNLQLSRQAN